MVGRLKNKSARLNNFLQNLLMLYIIYTHKLPWKYWNQNSASIVGKHQWWEILSSITVTLNLLKLLYVIKICILLYLQLVSKNKSL